MTRYLGSIFYCLFLWLLIAAACWPVFCAVSLTMGYLTGEGWVLDALTLEPKRVFLAHFLEGYTKSLIFSIPIGLLAVLDYLLMSRTRITWMISGLTLPLALAIGVFFVYKDPMPILPTFLIAGFVLVILYRLADALKRLFA
ncbi:MAG: hypothetical protein KTR35_12345 [Gammaproteobacteria bacterium]|nr:hypothetical protein [Gammaproteobacteria bacterium]